MRSQKAKELATVGTRFPFQNFLSVLEAGVQDIHRAPKDPSAAKVVATGASATEDLDGRKSIGLRDVVVEPGGVRESEGPQLGVEFVGPMDLQVQEHSPGARCNDTNRAFGMCVLMVSADARDGLGLLVRTEGFSPGLASKDPVITVEGLDVYTALSGFGLERLFAG
jgi:hypothetical protein